MISSAKHSEKVLCDLKVEFLEPMVMKYKAYPTLLMGETSTAYFLTVPPDPILVESSLAPPIWTAKTRTSMGFLPVINSMISKAYLIILMARHFLPVFLP